MLPLGHARARPRLGRPAGSHSGSVPTRATRSQSSWAWRTPPRRRCCITERPNAASMRSWARAWSSCHGTVFTSRLTSALHTRSALAEAVMSCLPSQPPRWTRQDTDSRALQTESGLWTAYRPNAYP